ncbi:MAG TPA: hypothetical protein VNA89_16325 [Gemmatimonadaceae bacterium]|nr:hypothetical protein [Gemmatimonadaceae bacterium]
MTGPLARYAPWQLRDFLAERGAATLLIGALMLVQGVIAAAEGMGPSWASGPAGGGRSRLVLATVLPVFAFVGTVTAVNGIVANDRKLGYYRFLFVKPLPVPLYYAQLYLVHGLGLMLGAAALLALFAAAVAPDGLGAALVVVGLVYVAAGGVGFLFSVVTSFDWLLLGGTWVLAYTLQDNRGVIAGSAFAPLAPLIDVLPPVERLDRAARLLIGGVRPDLADVLWPLAYGAGAFLLGLILVRRRPLAA